jgi:PPOX class probable F420-dependent enzyme
MSLTMTKAERETFLADTHVAIISLADASGRGPLSVPVWYSYTPGDVVRFVTAGTSRKADLIRRAGRLSLCVQTETPPYKYVSVEGPAVLGTPEFDRDIRSIAHRYLGAQMGDLYLQATADDRAANILVVVTPERWLSVDYTKMSL